MMRLALTLSVLLTFAFTACADEADDLGIGGECTAAADCNDGQQCLTAFKGGYCGLENCTADADCPEASRCVTHDDGVNYCFRTCTDKAECNENRSADNESNCSANVTFSDGSKDGKACVPPSN